MSDSSPTLTSGWIPGRRTETLPKSVPAATDSAQAVPATDHDVWTYEVIDDGKEAGVAAVFTPGTPTGEVVDFIKEHVA